MILFKFFYSPISHHLQPHLYPTSGKVIEITGITQRGPTQNPVPPRGQLGEPPEAGLRAEARVRSVRAQRLQRPLERGLESEICVLCCGLKALQNLQSHHHVLSSIGSRGPKVTKVKSAHWAYALENPGRDAHGKFKVLDFVQVPQTLNILVFGGRRA